MAVYNTLIDYAHVLFAQAWQREGVRNGPLLTDKERRGRRKEERPTEDADDNANPQAVWRVLYMPDRALSIQGSPVARGGWKCWIYLAAL